jgi:hypothetical protein
MTPSRAEIITFRAATLTIVGGAAGLLLTAAADRSSSRSVA